MSLSGSTSQDYGKTGDGLLRHDNPSGPEPTRENPAGVFPQTTGPPARPGSIPGSGSPDRGGDVRGVFGNPQVFNDVFKKLSSAFTDAMNAIKDESGSGGVGTVGQALAARLEAMQGEIDGWMVGKGLEGVDGERGRDVKRPEGTGGGLYKE
ncbi:hypothetical protein M231_03734 [Tremella mesenterica]|uniref:Uncharacterized protein n=1 Tax=Tremella mesenterica TaxID=5217 RepID=A0A4Q1BMG0_TREME|nr:hypothetical protein M231_03734 [Tremella mesenterica]